MKAYIAGKITGDADYQNGVRLDNGGLVDDDYYCRQHTGCCEDDYYGELYFKTDVPGQFVEISFGYY